MIDPQLLDIEPKVYILSILLGPMAKKYLPGHKNINVTYSF